MHTHPHAQISYVLSGKFQATVGNKTVTMSRGDTYSVMENEPHGVICLSKGTLLDVFSPMREDFIK